MSSARRKNIGKVNWLLLAVLAGGALASLFFVGSRNTLPTPVSIGQAKDEPLSIHGVGGAWYWREQPLKGKGRLIRATIAGMKEIATADALPSFDTDGKTLVWTARQGAEWSVMSANVEGGGGHAVWSGKEEPRGVKMIQERIYWLLRTPAPIDIALPFPPLQSSLQIVSVPIGGGALEASARLPEADDGEALGISEGSLYVRAVRMSSPGATSLYRVNTQNRTFTRITSVARHLPALLTRNGTLYWLAPSKETDSPQIAMQVFRMGASGTIEPLTDWLPAGGALYETANDVLYADREMPPSFWRLGSQDVFPTTLPLPKDFTALALGDTTALVMSASTPRSKPALYQIPLQ